MTLRPGDRLESTVDARYAWSSDTGEEDAFVASSADTAKCCGTCRNRGPLEWRAALPLHGYFRQRPDQPAPAPCQHCWHDHNVRCAGEELLAVAIDALRATLLNAGLFEDELQRGTVDGAFAPRHTGLERSVLSRFAGQEAREPCDPCRAAGRLWPRVGDAHAAGVRGCGENRIQLPTLPPVASAVCLRSPALLT